MAEWNYAEWAEKAGIENLKGRLATGDVLLAQANTLLSFLMAGIGGGLAFTVQLMQSPKPGALLYGVGAVLAWLAWVAAVLVFQCVATRETETLYNEPANIYRPALGLIEIEVRGYEMEHLQARINFTKQRNAVVAFWLDRCRFAAIATPAVFAIAVWVAAG